jgi:hypothetical protein
MMKRIFLRLIEKISTDVPTELKLQEIMLAIETLINIQWELSPEVDSRGDFKMVVLVSENTNFEVLLKGLDDAGYIGVI